MPKKASERRRKELGEQNLLLNPMMDMFAVLIPALMMMSVIVEVASVDIAVPSAVETNAKSDSDTPLNLQLFISDDGYLLKARGEPLNADGKPADSNAQITLPLIEGLVACAGYRDTVPPPRARNAKEAPCKPTDERRKFWVYDTQGLRAVATTLKDAYPDERLIIISAAPTVDFEPIANAMDATRDVQLQNGTVRPLFDRVSIAPFSQGTVDSP